MLSCGVFAKNDSLNVPRLSELHILSSMINGIRIDPGLATQLYSATASAGGRIVIGDITPLFGVQVLSLT